MPLVRRLVLNTGSAYVSHEGLANAQYGSTRRKAVELKSRLIARGSVAAPSGCKASKWSRLNSYDDVTCRVWIDKCSNGNVREVDPNGYVFKVTNAEDSQHEQLNFWHPGLRMGSEFFWSLESLKSTLPRFCCYDNDPKKKKMMKRWYNEFDRQVLRKLDKFKKCVLHGDFNEQNLLCDEEGRKIVGVIDFNDFHYSCRIFDVALLCAYMLLDSPLGMGTVGYILAGYVRTIQNASPDIAKEWMLTGDEYKWLRTCMMGRLVQSLVNGKYTWDGNPVEENRYVLVTQEKGWRVMWRLDGMSEDQFQLFISEVFKLYHLEMPS